MPHIATRGVEQVHVNHEGPLIIILLNKVLLTFDDDMLNKHNHFMVIFAISRNPVATLCRCAAIATNLFLHNGSVFPNKGHLILKYSLSRT